MRCEAIGESGCAIGLRQREKAVGVGVCAMRCAGTVARRKGMVDQGGRCSRKW